MKPSTHLYACLKVLTMLHVVEQLIFGMEDLHELQHLLIGYESHFGNTWSSIAALVMIAGALGALAIRNIAKGGFARFVTMFALGLPTLGEFHHVVEIIRAGHYTPGAVTAVPSVICGLLFLRALVREYSPTRTAPETVALQLGVAT
ncbi:MAG TPA: hypothetical protein VMG82_35730 [Candidatus Sulfotelmatobacter sp.]|nr:hypothetical protein [Candidatus Sulfotelmatobacter sp.]